MLNATSPTNSTNAAAFTSIQTSCNDQKNVPFAEQRRFIYIEFGVLSLAFFLALVYAAASTQKKRVQQQKKKEYVCRGKNS